MPLSFLLDEHLRGTLWRAIRHHNARGLNPLDVVRVGDPENLPLGSLDPEILLWAEREERILVSEDRKTLPRHLADHLLSGHHSPGIFTIRGSTTLSRLISFLELAAYASEAHEWQDRIEYIP